MSNNPKKDDIISDNKVLTENKRFYIANYGTMENIEIFLDYKDAKKESINNEVYEAILNHKNVWYEDDLGWNYEDNSSLFITSPKRVIL